MTDKQTMNKLKAFVLAAGLGERLRPITEYIPKPLLPIAGKPVLQSVLEKVSAINVNKIGINLFHKKDMIKDWIDQSIYHDKAVLFPEAGILGTGGALKNAEEFLRESIFLVHNSDVLSDINLERLLEAHLLSGNIATLAVHHYPKFNNVIVDEQGFLSGLKTPSPSPPPLEGGGGGRGDLRKCAFTGIALYSPEFLQFIPDGVSSVVDAWLRALSAGFRIGTMDASGCYWSDIGTPSSYASAVFDSLRADGEMIYIDPLSKGCDNAEMNGYVVMEKESILESGASLRNSILLPGSRTANFIDDHPSPIPLPQGEGARGRVFENCIIGPDFKIDLNESELLNKEKDGKYLIGTGGSDRKYFRIKKGGKTSVLMECAAGDPDFQRQIEYTRFFQKHSIPVPELIEIMPEEMRAVFEDLGDLSLYSWLKCLRNEGRIEAMYKKIIDMLVIIHSIPEETIAECPMLQERIFGYKDFIWESDYFIERFVKGIKNIKTRDDSALTKELKSLASEADSFQKTIMHRDFQSQNIMITSGGTPRLIDYQGTRIGPPAYDLASLIWDPYYRLESGTRERLIDYYILKMHDTQAGKFNAEDFNRSLLLCRIQRHMQALGAYGFLSNVKGKRYFLKYVPEGVRLLQGDLTEAKDEYPELYYLAMRLLQ
ncbi:MAG: phosphotransferase [Nitrospirae bacterium]|nr:phosphotransferase [Nitrospirota bacterium]